MSDDGIIGMLKKTPPHYLFGAMLFAMLWLVSEFFISRKEYEKDYSAVNSTLSEIRGDIKEILKQGSNR